MLPARRLNSLNDFFNDFFEDRTLEKVGGNLPAINVAENEKEYRVEVAAPGMTKEDFKVHINRDGNLVIEMEKKGGCCKNKDKDEDKDKKECKYLRKEFCYSKFSQTLLLPDNVDKDAVEACVENGILYVKVPKLQKPKAEEERKFIEIK